MFFFYFFEIIIAFLFLSSSLPVNPPIHPSLLSFKFTVHFSIKYYYVYVSVCVCVCTHVHKCWEFWEFNTGLSKVLGKQTTTFFLSSKICAHKNNIRNR